jgi:hypothetical protein
MKILTPSSAALALCLLLGATATAHAQRVVRDVVTGELRAPTAAEAKQLDDLTRAMRNRVSRGVLTGTINPKPVRQADGGDLLEATDDDQMYSVVVLGKDGQLVRHCVSNPELAARIGRGEITAFAPNLMERLNER